jgi:branched-chain amino acid transport system ATP-binding protein
MAVLELKNIHAAYGEIPILKGVDISIKEGQLVAVMGPNGAGKSTVLKAIFGLVKILSGEVVWQGNLIKPSTEKMVRLGISYVPQGRQIFSTLTIEQNLEMGGYTLPNNKVMAERMEISYALFPFLKERRKTRAGTLSGGQQQMLAVARGLMTDPKLLLLDEPTLGLSPKMVSDMFDKIVEINRELKTPVCVVEHNIKTLFKMVHKAYILNHGEVFACGTPAELESKDALSKVFLAHSKAETNGK